MLSDEYIFLDEQLRFLIKFILINILLHTYIPVTLNLWVGLEHTAGELQMKPNDFCFSFI